MEGRNGRVKDGRRGKRMYLVQKERDRGEEKWVKEGECERRSGRGREEGAEGMGEKEGVRVEGGGERYIVCR